MSDSNASERTDDATRILELLHRVEPLKHLPRTGWVERGVSMPESVAAHCWRLALVAWLMADALGLDACRAMKLALVHDMPEAITGDRTPFDDQGLTPEAQRALFINPEAAPDWRQPAARRRKIEAERQALHTMLADQPAPLAAALQTAWEEYEDDTTPEAILVQQLDKLEAYTQGCEYARDGRLAEPETLNSFRLDNERLVQQPAVRALLAALEQWARPAAT
ncbi:MAG TPA: HD domain-containing protein [Chloroflexota bacterium]|jgi:putative hydrolase of HD superfamily|nr:HD domain-containing protein [Chloroflexota bacterium]